LGNKGKKSSTEKKGEVQLAGEENTTKGKVSIGGERGLSQKGPREKVIGTIIIPKLKETLCTKGKNEMAVT